MRTPTIPKRGRVESSEGIAAAVARALDHRDIGALRTAICGEPTVEAFMSRVGLEYPLPRVNDGRRRLWLRDDLDKAILPIDLEDRDAAEDL